MIRCPHCQKDSNVSLGPLTVKCEHCGKEFSPDLDGSPLEAGASRENFNESSADPASALSAIGGHDSLMTQGKILAEPGVETAVQAGEGDWFPMVVAAHPEELQEPSAAALTDAIVDVPAVEIAAPTVAADLVSELLVESEMTVDFTEQTGVPHSESDLGMVSASVTTIETELEGDLSFNAGASAGINTSTGTSPNASDSDSPNDFANDVASPAEAESPRRIVADTESAATSTRPAPFVSGKIPNIWGPDESTEALVQFDLSEFQNIPADDIGLSYSVKIEGVDSQEIYEFIRSVIMDERFGWHPEKVLRTIDRHSGTLTWEVPALNPVKASVLVSKLRSLPVRVSWVQRNGITDLEI